ncbi:MAG: SpoIIE family protein phosphatase [Candidatus Krumholzibacteriota bacterium]|nr:SpoIIE family protein phosphatase [Candidatus Krumholzibacteriota bacterium]
MPPPRGTLTQFLLRAALALALCLALFGLVERWTGPDLPFRLRHLRVIPNQASEPGQIAPLMAGDRLLGIAGITPQRDHPALSILAARARHGPVKLAVERDGSRLELTLRPSTPGPMRRLGWTLRTLGALLVIFMGAMVHFRRRDPLGNVFLLLTLLVGSLFALHPRLGSAPWRQMLEWESDLVGLLLAPLLLHFLILFPEQRPRRQWLGWLLYLPVAILGAADTVAISADAPYSGWPMALQGAALAHSGLFLLAGIAVLVLKAVRRKHRRERHRLRLVLVGAALGLLPLAVFQFLHEMLPGRRLLLADWTPLFLTFPPLSFALGILGRDLQALNRLARRALALLMAGGVLVLVFLGMRLLLFQAFGTSSHVAEAMFLDLVSLGAGLAAFQLLRRRLRRARGESGDLLLDSRRWLAPPRYFRSRAELQRSLLPRLGGDIGAAWVICLEPDGQGAWVVCDGWRREGGPPQSLPLPPTGTAYRLPAGLERALLAGSRRILAVEQWDPYWAETLMGSEALPFCQERDWNLLAAVRGEGGQPPLILVLGPAVERSLYPSAVLDGLEGLLPTLELLLRSLGLLEQATHEEQLRTELDLARSIQQRLLPQTPPSLPHLEITGRVLSSSEVGGDYFDWLELPGQRVGLALGDASGHGIPAALLISSVALAFRSEAAGGASPERVVTAMNSGLASLAAGSDDPARVFSCFVYALYEPAGGTLRYCNAGMPAPWLFRGDGARVERLDRGGGPMGLDPAMRYRSGVLRMRPGDLLFLRSDGLEDQEDAAEIPYGPRRLQEYIDLQRRQAGNVNLLAEALMAELLAYAGGRSRDDISFVIMRLAP